MTTTTTTVPAQLPRTTPWQTTRDAGCGLCGFLMVFGLSHLALIQITKPSGYVFFGTLALAPPLVTLVLTRLTPLPRVAAGRFAFGAAMCLLAVPAIYLARFFPMERQATVRNLIGLPFFALALLGPGVARFVQGHRQTVKG